MSISQSIKNFRKAKNMTQAELGAKTGIKQNSISRLESDDVGYTVKTLLRLGSVLGFEVVLKPIETIPKPQIETKLTF